MNYVKKMCILRQAKQGFSGDGKALSGLVKVEQYGKNLAVEVSVINFAPLISGEYYCVLSDRKGRTEMLPLRGKSLFNILTDMEVADGFCAVICFVKNEILPIAYGVNGNGSYDWKSILNATLPPLFTKQEEKNTQSAISETPAKAEEASSFDYDDETLAAENYYQEDENEQIEPKQAGENARFESGAEKQNAQAGACATENDDAPSVLHPFKTESDGYYVAVKAEIDELMGAYPRDERLNGAFSCSEWVRIRGDEDDPKYLVGVVYDEGKARYICYALAAENKDEPPEEIKDVCTFVPSTPFDENKGFFVIFQSASTGECIKPLRA